MALGIGENMFFTAGVIGAVANYGIARSLILVGHRLRRLLPALIGEAGRRMKEEPDDVLLTRVRLVAEPMAEFHTEGETEFTEPPIVLETGARPNGTGMLRVVDRHIAAIMGPLGRRGGGVKVGLQAGRLGKNPVGRIEQLGRLQNHLNNMLVAVPPRAACCLVMQIEDIHVQVRVITRRSQRR